jgi:hypothetical protein
VRGALRHRRGGRGRPRAADHRRSGGPDVAGLHLPEGGGPRGPVRGSRPAPAASAPGRVRVGGDRLERGARHRRTRAACGPAAPRQRRGRHLLRQPERAHDVGALRAAAAPCAGHAQPLFGDIRRPAAAAPDLRRDVREPRVVPDPRRRPHRLHAGARREPVGLERLADDGARRAPPAARDHRARRHGRGRGPAPHRDGGARVRARRDRPRRRSVPAARDAACAVRGGPHAARAPRGPRGRDRHDRGACRGLAGRARRADRGCRGIGGGAAGARVRGRRAGGRIRAGRRVPAADRLAYALADQPAECGHWQPRRPRRRDVHQAGVRRRRRAEARAAARLRRPRRIYAAGQRAARDERRTAGRRPGG